MMERIEIDEAITLDDDKEYYVVEIVEQEGHRYLYLVNEAATEVLVAEEIVEGEDVFVETLDDQSKIAEIVKIVRERLNNN